MSVTADYLSEHPFAPTDIVNPPEAPTYRYRPDIETLVAFAGVETAALSAGSRVDLVIDDILLTYVLRSGTPTGSDLEVVPDDYDADFNAQYWLLVESGSNPGTISFSDITGVISEDQLPPGSVAAVDSIGEDALYFFDETTSTPFLISSLQAVEFISGVISFSDLSGFISVDQFPAGSVASIDSIDEDGFYFFDNDTFSPELLGKDDALSFLLPDQTGNDGFVLQTNAGVLSWVEMTGGGAGAWGDLTGTLSDQTDLQSALDGKQPLDGDLTTIAGLTATTDNFIVSVSSAWASRTPSQVRTTLGLVIGTNVQAWDADLDTIAGLTATTNNFIVSVSSAWASRTPAQVKTTLAIANTDVSGLGTLSTQNGTFSGTSSGTNTGDQDLSGYQPLDGDLTTIAGLTATTDNFIVSVSSAWASRTPTQVKTTLGLVIGTNVQAWDADLDTLAGLTATTDNFIVSVSSAWASRTPTQVKTTLGLVIGTNVQAWDADLDTLAGLTATTDNFIVSVASAWASRTPAQVLSTLAAVGTTFQPLDSDLTTIAGLTATTDNFIVSVASAWASRTPAQVLSTLAAVGTTFQPLDSDLTTIAGLTATTDNFIVSVSSAWASRTPSQVRTTLALVIGTNVQAWDADLDTWAGVTPAANMATFIATPSSANLRATMTDEIGTGACVFDGATLTLLLTTATCGSSLASLNIPAGTVPTTPNDGDIFADANCFYGCTDAGNPGYIPIVNVLRADSTVTQANDANAHAIFTTPANGRITLETGTYRFSGMMAWTSMSGTAGNLKVDLLGAGTASTGNWLWMTDGVDLASASAPGAGGHGWWNTSATNASCVATTTATALGIIIEGTVEVTGAGTLIPTQTLANASAAVLSAGSYIEFWRIGSASLTSVGQWD